MPILPFAAHSELPCMVPDGQLWMQCMANRTFKTRVIDLVLLRLPMLLLKDRPDRRLIVDYQQPAEYRFDAITGMIHSELIQEMQAMGEADLKFTRYANRYGGLVVDSIDGDSIPIALMHHELCLRRATPPPVMLVYRLELNTGLPPAHKKDTASGPAKRSKPNEPPLPPRAPTANAVANARKRRTYEYVNIHALYAGLMDVIAQSTGRIRIPTHAGHEMAMLISLIALTGTDFSRNLPQMSGRSVYNWLPDIWPTLVNAYHPGMCCLVQENAVNRLVALLYRTKFPKHTRQHVGEGGLSDVLQDLQGSSISSRVKESLPSYERITCTVRNANWVLAYWTCEPAPDPIQHAYGFRVLPGGQTEYDD